ncbi:bifunctional cobalt-precorrin-7 (C(5))-methyltransferase/cobalt-precorrin-6B (C(15))-methyltransferase [Saccharopolyspora rectivirgula]|jgi:precorrin-6Y C5,15-methyltransferase (decarboxylating)|uniref:Precorrin-6Y C5,15-methyltransferase n=1 Tax=Saccharopolyspora rectivirgula TaxID=28042 RepID=A0A073AYF7_9PSEU|nr:bifunctional cobalt-precorrin-7 (C(5))-methyltransferase/cobalt-precorrin-6B (C(15))-methyltransferase [Saccharopolyspora rectivirgula]KEI44366.1 precorrin-6Y C5,15-methyltransferase [Saccharopolyspora rectivirgula]
MSVTVIGIDGAGLPPGGAEALESARIVIGARRHLDAHAPEHVRKLELGPIEPALNTLAALAADERGVVLASGDPGFFGIVRVLRERGIHCTVLPATSSVQQLVARVGRPWDDVIVVSAHGRDLTRAANVCRAKPAVAVLTAPGAGPAQLGSALCGWRRTLVVAENLGLPEESLVTVDPAEAARRTWYEPNIVLSLADLDAVPQRGWIAGAQPLPETGWALPEDDFSHRDGMITKAEVRAVALAKLAPRLGSLVWDVGAGSGSVAIECARMGAAVIAVESDENQIVRLLSNAAVHGVDVRIEEGKAPRALRELPKPDAIFVGGGGTEVITACAHVGASRVVVALAALDRVTSTRDVLRSAGYEVEGVQLSASRMTDLPDGSSRLEAVNPVLLVCGQR